MADSEKVMNEEEAEGRGEEHDSRRSERIRRMVYFIIEYAHAMLNDDEIRIRAIPWEEVREVMESPDADVPDELLEHYRELCEILYSYPPEEKKEEAPEVPLAQYAKDEMFQIHDFALKTVNEGLIAIAMGAADYELTPKRGKSQEQYRLTASEAACTDFFSKGGNSEIVKAVLGTVHQLKSDPRAADFIKEGRVWFSVNKITEEALRTNAGTIRARDYHNTTEIVDAALVMASGAQVVGRNANGEPTDVTYLVDAVRLDTVKYSGNTYHDVWGFAMSRRTISEHAIEQGHAYHYPLSDSKKPFTIDTLAINEYLSDAINEARGKLYTSTKTGRPRKIKRDPYQVTRSWTEIFKRFSPVRDLSSRQKNVLVKKFEEVLTDLVRQESHGRREGRPLYIYAWSERNGSRGRGKGKYTNLVIEASNELHAVRDGSAEHGCINLVDGEEGKMPNDVGKR